MPTGYTADIKDGIDFKSFVLQCSRAFLVQMRDESWKTPIPDEIVPSSFCAKQLEIAKKDLEKHYKLSSEKYDSCALKDWKQKEASRKEHLEKAKRLRVAYESMLENVRNWMPPTSEHEGLKSFMIEQLESSIKFDCNEDYYLKPTPRITGIEWFIEKEKELFSDVEYYSREHEKEVTRAEHATKWIKNLKASLE